LLAHDFRSHKLILRDLAGTGEILAGKRISPVKLLRPGMRQEFYPVSTRGLLFKVYLNKTILYIKNLFDIKTKRHLM